MRGGVSSETQVAVSDSRRIVCRASTNQIRCIELKGSHLASVSQLQMAYGGRRRRECPAGGQGRGDRKPLFSSSAGDLNAGELVCMTSGYDGYLRVWDLGKGKREIAAFSSVCTPQNTTGGGGGGGGRIVHPSPLTHFVWMNSVAIAGTKAGSLKVWDINAGTLLASSKRQLASHEGGIGCLQLAVAGIASDHHQDEGNQEHQSLFSFDECRVRLPLLFSGGLKDGKMCLWDPRCFGTPVAEIQAHAGSLNTILIMPEGEGRRNHSDSSPSLANKNTLFCGDPTFGVCTLGADGACRFWDLRTLGERREAGTGGAREDQGCRSQGETGSSRSSSSRSISKSRAPGGMSACVKEIQLPGLHRQAFLCGDVVGRGLVVGGAADGSVYMMTREEGGEAENERPGFPEEDKGEGGGGGRSVPGGKNKTTKSGICWGYGCDKKGAVQVVRAVVTPEAKEERVEEEGGHADEPTRSEDSSSSSSRRRRREQGEVPGRSERVRGIVAGGDDGNLAFLGFG